MEVLNNIVNTLNGFLWSNWLLVFCLAAGTFFTIATKGVQFRLIKESVRLLFDGDKSDEGISSFQAFSLAVSGRVGTGNIAGVAAAIAFGGPGALFWMWVIALLGAASAFIEATLAQIYKEEHNGEYRGGSAYYIEKGLGKNGANKFWVGYALFFAFVAAVGESLFAPGLQSAGIANAMNNAFGIPNIATGVVITVILAFIVFGGVKRIGRVAELVVPIMTAGYIIVTIIVLVAHGSDIPATFSLIFTSAFSKNAVYGGLFGSALKWGVKRGIYSNEAGQGTAPHAAAAAEVSHPAKQGLVQAFSVYIDTILICTATGLMILVTGAYNVFDANNQLVGPEGVAGIDPSNFVGPEYTQAAVNSVIPGFGQAFVAIALALFAFTTIMAYFYIADTNATYLTRNGKMKWMVPAVKILLLVATFMGTIVDGGIAWAAADIAVGAMAWLNILVILLLSKPAFKALKDYDKRLKDKTVNERFSAKALDIENAEFWD